MGICVDTHTLYLKYEPAIAQSLAFVVLGGDMSIGAEGRDWRYYKREIKKDPTWYFVTRAWAKTMERMRLDKGKEVDKEIATESFFETFGEHITDFSDEFVMMHLEFLEKYWLYSYVQELQPFINEYRNLLEDE